MVVTPLPILLLLVPIQAAEVTVIVMCLDDPLIVVNPVTTVAAMIVVVLRIVIVVSCATGSDRRQEKRGGQKPRTEISGSGMHSGMPPWQGEYCLRDLGAVGDLLVAWLRMFGRGVDGMLLPRTPLIP